MQPKINLNGLNTITEINGGQFTEWPTVEVRTAETRVKAIIKLQPRME